MCDVTVAPLRDVQRRPSGVTHGAPCACRLAVLLGGDLHLTDREDRTRGVRYRLRLPCVPTVAPGEDAAATTTFSPQRLVPNMLLRWKVPVVDDVAGNRRLARRMLQQLGCEVIEASDGDEVVDAIETAVATTSTGNIPGPPDVVLMDIDRHCRDAPGRVGFDTCYCGHWARRCGICCGMCVCTCSQRQRGARAGAGLGRACAQMPCADSATCCRSHFRGCSCAPHCWRCVRRTDDDEGLL